MASGFEGEIMRKIVGHFVGKILGMVEVFVSVKVKIKAIKFEIPIVFLKINNN